MNAYLSSIWHRISRHTKKGGLFFFFRLVYSADLWIRRRFTKPGLLILGALIATAVVGIDTKQTVAYKGFAFLLSLILISIAINIFPRMRFTATRVLPRFGTVDETLYYLVHLHNKSRKPQRCLSFFENIEESLPSFEEFLNAQEPLEKKRNLFDRAIGYHRFLWLISQRKKAQAHELPVPTVHPATKEEIRAGIIPRQRGYLKLKGMTLCRPDPFGLFKSFLYIAREDSILVLPKLYPVPQVNLPGSRVYQSGGVALASSVGDSEEFISLRDYLPGDPLRKIHWRSWAKTGKPVVREYHDEFFIRHALVLDTFLTTEYSEIFEEAVSVAASFVYSMKTPESLLDLLFVEEKAYCFTSGRGLSHTDKMLEILASVKTCKHKEFSVLSSLIIERASMLSNCIIIFLTWDNERKEFIRRLEELDIPLLVMVITDHALSLPHDADYQENFHILEVGKIEEGLAQL
ncbi:MAG: DUF58 domain-containing protein [bacterium]